MDFGSLLKNTVCKTNTFNSTKVAHKLANPERLFNISYSVPTCYERFYIIINKISLIIKISIICATDIVSAPAYAETFISTNKFITFVFVKIFYSRMYSKRKKYCVTMYIYL